MKLRIIFITILSVVFLYFPISFYYDLRISYDRLNLTNTKLKNDLKNTIELIEHENLIKDNKIQNCNIRDIKTNTSCKLSEIYEMYPNGSIVLRLSSSGCTSCINKQLETLNNLQGIKNLIILSSEKNARYLRLFTNKCKYNPIVYQLESRQKLFQKDDTNQLLVVYLSKNGEIKRAYLLSEDTMFLLSKIIANT